METAVDGACSVHPERVTRIVCDRCGDFVCASCYELVPDGRALCASCKSIDDTAAVPWERDDPAWPKRFVRTVVQVVLRPKLTLGRLPPGNLGRSLLFAVIAAALTALVITGMVFVVLEPNRYAESSRAYLEGMLVVAPIAESMLLLVWTLTLGVLFHLTAKTLGGHGRFAETLHATSYVMAVWPWLAVISWLAAIPNVGKASLDVFYALLLLWPPRALWHVAHHVHGLREGRATAGAVLPYFVLMAPFAYAFIN